MAGGGSQRVIMYGPAGARKVYTTAYTDAQVNVGVLQCVRRYGKSARIRAVSAS